LIYSSPQPTPFEIEEHYGLPPEQYWTDESYFQRTPDYFSRQISTAKKLLSKAEGLKSLDVGAGLGKAMLSMTSSGFDAFGFEPSQPFYDRAISRMNISPDRLKLGMIENVDYEPEMFDFITFGAVFEHLYHPASCLKKAMKWLKRGGIVHIEVPNAKHLLPKIINFYYRLRGTNYVTHLSPMHSPFHLYEFGLRSFEKLSPKLAFSIADHYFDVGTLYHVPRMLHFPLSKYMKLTDTGMQLTVFLQKI